MCNSELASQVIDYWFNSKPDGEFKKWWFNRDEQKDIEINGQFNELYLKCYNNISDWKQSISTCLSSIIILDQFSRHLHRINSSIDIKDSTLKGKEMTKHLLMQKWDYTLSSTQLAFALMPLRHTLETRDLEMLTEHISKIETHWLNNDPSQLNSKVWCKFKLATNRQINKN